MSDQILDLRLRLFSEGGPMHQHLTVIQTGTARNIRATQFMYLGLLVEQGWVGVMQGQSRNTLTASYKGTPDMKTRDTEPVGDKPLDLSIRLFSDGGPLFCQLKAIQNSTSRSTRATQLMYLGLLVEKGGIASTQMQSWDHSPIKNLPYGFRCNRGVRRVTS